MQSLGSKVNHFGDWTCRLMALNGLWILFTIAGLGIFGVFPATAAMFSVIRQYLKAEKEVKIVKVFASYFRKDFWKANGLGFTFAGITAVLWVDFGYLLTIPDLFTFVLAHFILILLIFSIGSFIVLFPFFSHYELSFFQYVKHVFLYPFTHLGRMILLTVLVTGCLFIFYEAPGFIFFLGASLPGFIMMKIIYPSFLKERKEAKKGWFINKREESLYY